MHPVTFLLMTFLVSRYSTMAFVRHWVTSRQVCCRGPISSKFATIPKNVQLIGPSSKTVKNDMSRNDNEIWVLQFDGGSRGNPGVAGSGSVLYRSHLITDSDRAHINEKAELTDSEEVWYGYHYIGEYVTNNVAEYTGLIEGLKQAVIMNISAILIQGDSQLIIRQVQGIYKVKNEGMKKLHSDTKKLLEQIPCHSLEYIPRAQNARADELSNFAMDLRQNVSVLRPAEVSSPDTQAVSVLTAVPLPSTPIGSGIETSSLDATHSHSLPVALISTDSSCSCSSSGENTIPTEETVQKEKAPKRERKSKLQIEIRDIAISDVVCDTSIISQSVSDSDGTEAVVERIEGVQDGPIVKIKRKVSPKKSSATQEAVMKPSNAISEKKVKDKQMSTKEKVVKPKKLTAVKEKDTESSLKSRKEISSSDKEVEAELKEPRKRKIKMSS